MEVGMPLLPKTHGILAALLGLLLPAAGSVVINEIQSSNSSTAYDEDGDASDWVELVNTGSEPVDLEGWGISDRANQPFMWVFPARVLAPGERLLVWASGKDRDGIPGETEPPPLAAAPDEVPGLVLWLNAEAESFGNNDSVSAWADLSGKGNHAFAPGNEPIFRTNRINGLPAVTFSRTENRYLALPTGDFNGMSSLSDFTILTVARWQGQVASGLFGGWGASSSGIHSHFEIQGGNTLRLRVGASDMGVSSVTTANSWELFGASRNNSGDSPVSRLFLRDQQIGINTSPSGFTPLADYGTLSVGSSDSGRAFHGEIAEFVMYDRALSAQERLQVTNHLTNRYGISEIPVIPAGLELHTNFAISADGETIVLTRPDGTTADSVSAPVIPRDASYGRSPDGSGAFTFFAEPTPDAANGSTPYGPPAGQPVFSHPRGFYEESFDLQLSHPDPEAIIRYTVDGSEPTPSSGLVYSGPISIPTTRVVRALAVKTGALPVRNMDTHSYLFLDHVAQVTTRPDGYPASWSGFNQTSYAISPFVAGQPGYAAKMREALEALPVLSISASINDIFGGGGGVYSNPNAQGLEKEVSAEWMGLGTVENFQINAGLRVQGGASRVFSNTPKKSLRLLFKGAYGEGRLRHPVLSPGGGVEMADFNTLTLRADYNNSWLHSAADQRPRGSLVRDQWMRDTQIAMSGAGSGGNHVHLFLNGIYWGVYNPAERPDAAFAASYFGGEREDYDAMTHSGIRDGNSIAWNTMRSIAQGGLSSPAQYEAIQQYLDIDHFIDYMIVNIYGGNQDWPHNNWNATRLRQEGAGYKFFAWDAERSLESTSTNQVNVSGSNNPAEFYAALRQNAEFRLRFADRLHRHFFNGGALTPEQNISRYSARAAVVRTGIFAEEARWGSYRHELNNSIPRYGVDSHWDAERDRLLNVYFPVRSDIVISQFQNASPSLYPAVAAPSFSQHGGTLDQDDEITISAPAGMIYYTTDGSDPRVPVSGSVSPSALLYSGAISFANDGSLKARVLQGGVWSALNEADFFVTQEEPLFLPGGNGDWLVNENWTGGVSPAGPGSKALIEAPASGDRNINIRSPLTVGGIRFDEGSSPFRNRLRDQGTGNTLTFDGGDGNPAKLRVDGDGTGFVELEVLAGTILATDLELEVNHLAGDEEHGPLRLRADWTGPGGIIKTGPGVASFTGDMKNFTGPLIVREGVLRLTEPSVPSLASSYAVEPGGQLRLTSGGFRVYQFTSPLMIEGPGRGPEVPDGSGHGILGAIRYEPGSGANHAIIPQPVVLTGPASIHVNGGSNLLDLDGPLSGSHPLVKSGGGTLRIAVDSPGFDGHFVHNNGTLELGAAFPAAVTLAAEAGLTGHGETGAISGEGTITLRHTSLHAPSATGVTLSARIGNDGPPAWDQPASSGNGFLRLSSAPSGLAAIRAYVTGPQTVFRGLLFVPSSENLAETLSTTPVEIYIPDPSGPHTFDQQSWSLAEDVQVLAVPQTADFGDGPVSGKTLEIRIGDPLPTFESWLALAYPGPGDLENPDISGPNADPHHTGLGNLLRYALGFSPTSPNEGIRPHLAWSGGDLRFRFPWQPDLHDVAYIVEATGDLTDWSEATILFDSLTDELPDLVDGILEIELPSDADRMFFRLGVIRQ